MTFQFLLVMVDGSVLEAFKVYLRDRVLQRFMEQITLTLQFLRVVAALEVLKDSSRVLLALHPPRSPAVDEAFTGVFRLFPQIKKSAGLGPHSGSELGADFNPWTPAAYAGSMVLEEDELGM